MKCKRFETLIALHVEGDLPAGQTQRVEWHLAECSHCREFAEGLRISQSALKRIARDEVASASLDRIHARVMRSVANEPLRHSRPRWMLAFAAAVVIAIAALALWHVRESRRVAVPSTKHSAAATARQAAGNSQGRSITNHRNEIPGRELAKRPTDLPLPSLPHRAIRQALPYAKNAGLANQEIRALNHEGASASRRAMPTLPESTASETAASKAPAVKVKLLTNDPNVVIYMITD